MKRCLKFGVGGYEKIREKFPKITSCKSDFQISPYNAIFQIIINKELRIENSIFTG
jgi:hypothetical protein